jgi:hypothetical protein
MEHNPQIRQEIVDLRERELFDSPLQFLVDRFVPEVENCSPIGELSIKNVLHLPCSDEFLFFQFENKNAGCNVMLLRS